MSGERDNAARLALDFGRMVSRVHRWLVGAAVAAQLGGAALASAQSRDPAAAEALFRQGRDAAKAGDYAQACAKFRESNRLDPAVGTVFNIADCEQQQGRLATAWTLFQEVVQRLPPGDDRRAIAAERVAVLEPKLPRLTIRLGDAPDGTAVERDDVELGAASLNTALPVDPGAHSVVVRAPGHEPKRYEVELAEGEATTLVVEPGPEQSSSGEAQVQADSSSPTLGWVALGVGAAGVVVGGVTGLLVLDRKSTADERCDAAKRCDAEGYDAVESGRTLGTVSGVAFAVGAVGLATGAYLMLSRDEEGQPQTALVGSATPEGGGVWLHGHF